MKPRNNYLETNNNWYSNNMYMQPLTVTEIDSLHEELVIKEEYMNDEEESYTILNNENNRHEIQINLQNEFENDIDISLLHEEIDIKQEICNDKVLNNSDVIFKDNSNKMEENVIDLIGEFPNEEIDVSILHEDIDIKVEDVRECEVKEYTVLENLPVLSESAIVDSVNEDIHVQTNYSAIPIVLSVSVQNIDSLANKTSEKIQDLPVVKGIYQCQINILREAGLNP